MPIISIFSGGFCQEDKIIRDVIARTGYRHMGDAMLYHAGTATNPLVTGIQEGRQIVIAQFGRRQTFSPAPDRCITNNHFSMLVPAMFTRSIRPAPGAARATPITQLGQRTQRDGIMQANRRPFALTRCLGHHNPVIFRRSAAGYWSSSNECFMLRASA